MNDDYVLDVGELGAARLRLLNEVYGSASESLLVRAGLREGMRVLEVGCGIGTMSCWLAERIGPSGSLLGIDVSCEQVRLAADAARARGLDNARFVEANVYDLESIEGDFDLVYARLVLMHLDRPGYALAQMRAKLARHGVLVCEDIELDSSSCEPPRSTQSRARELSVELGAKRGCDFNLGRRLYPLVRAVGFSEVEVSQHQPVLVRGEAKRFEELCFREVGERIVGAGMATSEEVARIADDLQAAATDESVVYSLSRMRQVWARS